MTKRKREWRITNTREESCSRFVDSLGAGAENRERKTEREGTGMRASRETVSVFLRLGATATLALCCLATFLAFAACGGEPTTPPADTAAPPAAPPPTPVATVPPTATAGPAATPAPAPTETPGRIQAATAAPTQPPTPAPNPTATPTPAPTSTPTPIPTSTSAPTPTPKPRPTPAPTPTPGPNPAVAQYAPLLVEAASSYPAGLDFVNDGLSSGERRILDVAGSRLFSNPNFLASRWGPDRWPAEVKLASAQAIPLLMLEIDIARKPDGRHVITWPVDGLDRVLDDLNIYKGVCVSCYGKSGYDTVEGLIDNHYPIVSDQKHVHREMLKTFAYLALADGEGILIRSLMDNGVDDFELLYNRDISGFIPVGTSFGWRNLSFMSQITLPDETVESFPTTVYKVIGGAGSEREAVERWFDYLNKNMTHFAGGTEDFANIYRPYSQTPYTPEPGYLIFVGEAGSPSSTGATTSGFRLLGLKAEQFFSPKKGFRVGSVEIDGNVSFYEGNSLGLDTYTKNMPACALIRNTLDQVENFEFDTSCAK